MKAASTAGPDDLVFLGPKGGILRRSFEARVSKPAVESAGLPVEADWHRICEVLDRHGVEFIVVSGVAAARHGAQRPTKDFDSVGQSRDHPR